MNDPYTTDRCQSCGHPWDTDCGDPCCQGGPNE